MRFFVAFLAGALSLVAAPASASPLAKRYYVTPPSLDPFYVPPEDYAEKTPGSILRYREVANGPTAYGPYGTNIKSAYQILFRTTNSVGKPQAAVTTLFVPDKYADPKKHVSYQTPYDASYINCSPSSNLIYLSGNQSSLFTDFLLIAVLLNKGYFVSTTDYEGLEAAYTAGPQSAYATLDSVRAVLKSSWFTGISNCAKSALWGYSGGALACEWAAEFAPSYAPEIDFIGAALGGLTPNITSVYNAINAHIPAGLAPAGIIGLTRAYSNLSTFVNNHLVPATKSEFLQAGQQCYNKNTVMYAFKNISSYFTVNPIDSPIPQSIVNIAGIMGLRGPPKMPLYVYKAVKDEVSPTADTDALVKKYCSKGLDIVYDKNSYGGHATDGNLGAPAALRYLLARFEGIKPPSGCSYATYNISNFTAADSQLLGKTITQKLEQETAALGGL